MIIVILIKVILYLFILVYINLILISYNKFSFILVNSYLDINIDLLKEITTYK